MKNRDGRPARMQWLGMLVYLLSGAACGILMMRYLTRTQDPAPGRLLLYTLLMLPLLYAAMLIQTVIHEAGHLLFGLATGYRFSSFRILSWMWLKEGQKLRFRRLSIAGTGGQCLMAPPDMRNGRMPVMLYNLGGVILNLIASALFGALSLALPSASFLTLFLQLLSLIGVAFAVINGVPLHMGPVDNDGCNTLSLMRSSEAVRAFWIQMKVNELISRGVRLRDMPGDWFAVPQDNAMRNSLIAVLGVLACSRLMDEHRFAEAEALMRHVLSIPSGIVGLHRGLMVCDRIYAELIGPNRPEALSAMLGKEQTQLMKAMKQYPSVLRTQYALALLADRDAQKTEAAMKQFDRCASRYPYPSEIAGEKELMDIARDRSAQS